MAIDDRSAGASSSRRVARSSAPSRRCRRSCRRRPMAPRPRCRGARSARPASACPSSRWAAAAGSSPILSSRPRRCSRRRSPSASPTSTRQRTTARARVKHASGSSSRRTVARSSSRPRSRPPRARGMPPLREVEASLKRLGTDHVDLLHLHGLGDAADLAAIEAPNGALRALYELRTQKVAPVRRHDEPRRRRRARPGHRTPRSRLRADGDESRRARCASKNSRCRPRTANASGSSR